MSTRRFTADEVSRFPARRLHRRRCRTSKRRLRNAFERLTHGINDPRSERADCNIELTNGQRFKAGRCGVGAVNAEQLVSGRYTGTGMEWTMQGIVFPSYQEAVKAAKRLIARRAATAKPGQS